MSRKKVCKFLWIVNSDTKEVITPYRFKNEIGSIGGRVREARKENIFTDGISEKLNQHLNNIKALDVNHTDKSDIYSYYVELQDKDFKEVFEELSNINEKKEIKPFINFTINKLNEESFFTNELFCGSAKQELEKIKNILHKGEC